MMLLRIRALAAGAWAGMLLTIGALAAPAAFALLDRADAGRLVGRYFLVEARASIALAVLLIVCERVLKRGQAEDELPRPQFTVELMLALGALFCTIAGFEVVQPLMERARAGQGTWSFGTLHAVSSSFFAVKLVLVLVLAWRSCSQFR